VNPSLLIVDDEESVRESFRLVLQDDYDLTFAEDAKTTLRALKAQTFNLCLLDIMLPDGSGLDLLRQMKRRDESIDVIMVTALQGIETGLDAMVGKAQDYVTKPFQINELRRLIKKTLAKRASKRENLLAGINESKPLCLMGNSAAVRDLRKKIEAAAASESPVCLRGEKGSGVEDIAREIHLKSRRSKGPFVTFNCSNPSERQLEKELFGEEGDGKLPQVGKLEFADQGTLFLKQIDRMPLPIQDKLMGIFSKKMMFLPESGIHMPLNIRLIVSSEMDLTTKFARRFFIKNFYQFFMDITFSVPPLRERKKDIPLLIKHVLETAKTKMPVKKTQNKVIQLLTRYAWPGNLPELENSVEAMVFFSKKDTVTMDDIPLDILIKQMDMAETRQAVKISSKQLRRQFERIYIQKVLERHHGHQSRTAKDLGLHRNTLVGKMKELNLEEDYRKIVRKRRERGKGFRDF